MRPEEHMPQGVRTYYVLDRHFASQANQLLYYDID
jgi:hypothetical protein